MSKSFKNKVIVITGGASGIGKELAKQFLEQQASVVIVDRDTNSGAHTLSELRSYGTHIRLVIADIANSQQAANAFNEIQNNYPTVDYVINNAGVFLGGEIRDTPLADWHAVTQNNIFAIMNGAYFAYKIMRKQKYGHIVNVGSAAGLTPIPAMGIYGSTKYAIGGFTQALRNEAAEFGIRVSLVCPTIVDTPLYDTATYYLVDKKQALAQRTSFQSPEVAAARIIKGITKNKAFIHTSVSTKIISYIYRLSPGLYNIFAKVVLKKYRRSLRTK